MDRCILDYDWPPNIEQLRRNFQYKDHDTSGWYRRGSKNTRCCEHTLDGKWAQDLWTLERRSKQLGRWKLYTDCLARMAMDDMDW